VTIGTLQTVLALVGVVVPHAEVVVVGVGFAHPDIRHWVVPRYN
jgi:hypothetical protein